MILCGLFAGLCIACSGSTTDVVIECPSPSGSTTAILFLQTGGGAAGWAFHLLAIQPANLEPTLPGRFGRGPSVEVLSLDPAKAMTLEWKDDSHLAVEFAVGSVSTVFHMFHQYPMTGDRQVKVLFSERDASGDARHDFTCRTAGREIVNPPLKRLVFD